MNAAEGAILPTGTGITYRLTSASGLLPPGTRLQVCTVPLAAGGGCPAADLYCYNVASLTGYVPWSSFNTACWSPSSGTYLPARPQSISQVEVQVASLATATTTDWDICVASLSL
jgi:hypothetical protein